jgi:hypothetical protein
MNKYSVFKDGGHYNDFADVNVAISAAEEFLGGLSVYEISTFTVRDSSNNMRVLASVTNRRIVGKFFKQVWGGRKNDDAINCGEVEFDATDTILLMSHADLIALEDSRESTDRIGYQVVWDGPYEVYITGKIASYFGVDDIKEITPEALKFARHRHDPQPVTNVEITIKVKLNVRVAAGASLANFFYDMDATVTSLTPGVVVTSVGKIHGSMECAPTLGSTNNPTATATPTTNKSEP